MQSIKGYDKIVYLFFIYMNINCGYIINKLIIFGYLLDF